MLRENSHTGWGRSPFFYRKSQNALSWKYKCILYTIFCEKGILLFVTKNEKIANNSERGSTPFFNGNL